MTTCQRGMRCGMLCEHFSRLAVKNRVEKRACFGSSQCMMLYVAAFVVFVG